MSGGVWRKTLYERTGLADNYTPPECFLAAIQRNKDLRLYSRAECLAGAAVLGRELSLVITFWSLYHYLSLGWISHDQLLLALLLVTLAGYIHYSRSLTLSALWSRVRTTLLFLTIGYALSPVLFKLTDTVSTDTIHSMSVSGLLIHLLTQHYGLTAPPVSRSLSLNSAIFSTVCLASRFPGHLAAFSLLCLAVFCFLLVPMWNEAYRPNPVKSVLSALVSVCLLARVLPGYTLLAAGLFIFIQVCCPLLYCSLQSHKQTIHGPWDEAVLN